MSAKQNTNTQATEPVRHAAASYQTGSPQRNKPFCGAETGDGIAAAWNYVTCTDCYPANRYARS